MAEHLHLWVADGFLERATAAAHLRWIEHDRAPARESWQASGAPRRRASDQPSA